VTVPTTNPRIAAVILAAGSSRRMGANKLLATIGGKPLVRIVADAAIGSRASPVVVVTGNDAGEVMDVLSGLPVTEAFNPNHASGLAGSLAAGLAALPANADGAVVLLADMPGVDATLVDRLIAAFRPGRIVVPTFRGRRGNPVVWSQEFFPQLRNLSGDVGGRFVIEANGPAVIEVGAGDAVASDVDTPEALQAVGGKIG
jgi:molybdenum cofactor cytidylyltransferase